MLPNTSPDKRSLFQLGRDVSLEVERPLRPSRGDLKAAAAKLGVTQREARRALDFYMYGDDALA